MAAAVRAIIGWFGGGSALAALVSVLLAVAALVLGLVYHRYLGILGANRRRSAERGNAPPISVVTVLPRITAPASRNAQRRRSC
jgi:hypothetical protein